MAESVFFTKGRNKGNQRKIVLKSATLLPGKANSKQKRIKMKFTMALSSQKPTGMPDWLVDAFEFVSKSHDTVTPEIKLSGFDVEFSAENLFGDKAVAAPRSEMRGFIIYEAGGETPEVLLAFTMYSPFSDRLCRWAGQMLGDEFYGKFDQVVPVEGDDEGPYLLTPEEQPEEESEEEDEEE